MNIIILSMSLDSDGLFDADSTLTTYMHLIIISNNKYVCTILGSVLPLLFWAVAKGNCGICTILEQ